MKEEWRPAAGFESRYEVSSIGRVRASGGKRAGTILRQTQTTLGRYHVNLFDPETRKVTTLLIHRLVLASFVGPCPEGMVGCHNDGDHLNNQVTNLRWDTQSANRRDCDKHGTMPRGERHHHSRFTEEEVRHLRYLARDYRLPLRYLARVMGCSQCAIQSLIRGRTWSHIPLLPARAQ